MNDWDWGNILLVVCLGIIFVAYVGLIIFLTQQIS